MKREFLTTAAAAATAAVIAMPASAQSVRYSDEGDWVSLYGTVNNVEEDSFTLDYGSSLIEVEIDSLFQDADLDEKLRPGEAVTVYGEVDDDLFEGRVVDAERIFARDRYTYYTADDLNLSSLYYIDATPSAQVEGTWLSLSGEVQNVDGREFTLDTGGSEISVDTMEMSYNPLDKKGDQQIAQGDRVTVAGEIDDALFDEAELSASYLYKIEDQRMAQATAQKDSRKSGRSAEMKNKKRSDSGGRE